MKVYRAKDTPKKIAAASVRAAASIEPDERNAYGRIRVTGWSAISEGFSHMASRCCL